MRMEIGLSQNLLQKQILSPQMIQSMEILVLNSQQLEEKIEQELEENIALEIEEPKSDSSAESSSSDATLERSDDPSSGMEGDGEMADNSEIDLLRDRYEHLADYQSEEYYTAPGRLSSLPGEEDDKFEVLQNTPDRPASLQEHLIDQIRIRATLTPRQRELCHELIYNLDHRGYLMYPIEEILAALNHTALNDATLNDATLNDGEALDGAPSSGTDAAGNADSTENQLVSDESVSGEEAEAPPSSTSSNGGVFLSPSSASEVLGAWSESKPDAEANGTSGEVAPDSVERAGYERSNYEQVNDEHSNDELGAEPLRSESLGADLSTEHRSTEPLQGSTDVDTESGAHAEVPFELDTDSMFFATPIELPVGEEELLDALTEVQSLDPAGVGATDLISCLLLQLDRDSEEYPLEKELIRGHLKDIAKNRLPHIAKAVGRTIDEVKDAIEIIASLNPLPGSAFSSEPNSFVRPDVQIYEEEGEFKVRVDREALPRLRISPYYRELLEMSKKDPEIRKYIKKKIDNAEWLLHAIQQRRSTLHRVAEEVVAHQQEYFKRGSRYLKPLKMQQIADRIGVNVSTVSRAISGKYFQAPGAIRELKYLFTGGTVRDDGTMEARGSVIQRIRDLIAEEDKRKPLSDSKIVEKLKGEGIHISRRTVTKYREAESIPSSRERREY